MYKNKFKIVIFNHPSLIFHRHSLTLKLTYIILLNYAYDLLCYFSIVGFSFRLFMHFLLNTKYISYKAQIIETIKQNITKKSYSFAVVYILIFYKCELMLTI